NYECKYNLNTWRNGEYLGCGLSAESHIDNKRYENTYNLKDYLNGGWKSIKKIAYINNLSRFETKILLGLRLQEGVNLNLEINSMHEKNRKEFLANLEKQVEQGNIIYFGKDNIKIPKEKYLILDKIIDDLLL